ncbi:hypothetical protein HRR83_007525 [Exophiala dermatitidis]|uniref:Distal membrane-arm assembly complex protein 1-like domain-containing protein n=2 Tax=Exophiala dermatitidis TaxID=5970 RepID=H6C2S4_EXODN|nr:uncharacterized protein HMPREF1120_06800 [Exophiala dermatitidis NIH/UT8656]KAJ4510499.1 hypothetical protein HRR74_006971 [Exophiala dermatitidis]EHY58797.1 hypothetical protein HMPREF1120_06800 [Exophiala dermatitidis NIH/UT8656]KAJ4510566.1 hypothetical protein HRR73_006638 [Exophiala dermatitidis]KAJ4531529.1 hypothetical protein HRR77_009384 [Exophiala dermatitidis]KAJ4553359.1 hypothetical protein HRR79_009647 [Exophiala dermatitidis]
MVLKELFSPRRDKFDDFEDPKAFDKDDCLSCRVLGSTALVSLGGYTYYSGMQQLRLQRKAIELSKSKYKYGSRQLGILCLSGSLFGLGIYRMSN